MEITAPPPSRRPPGSAGPRLYGLLAALAGLIALACWFAIYPLDRWIAGILLGLYGLGVALWPSLWLVLMPALWPLADLTPWSGHIHFTESDALALTTLVALGLRETFAPPPFTLAGRAPVKLTLSALAVFGLLAASVLISGLRGLGTAPAFDAAALVGYNTPLNALRVGKGFVLALALIPFLHLAIRRGGEAALDRFGLGLVVGLTTCSLAALWERLAFTSLTDFASDYRTAALFWEMHVGGAALDAWLSLCFPFGLACLFRARSPLGRGLAMVAVGLGSYALLTTFSRIVYGALLVSAVILGGMALRQGPRTAAGAPPRGRPGVLLALAAGLMLGAILTFQDGGYRGLLAYVGLVLLAHPAGGLVPGMPAGRLLTGLLTGLLLVAFSAAASLWVPKGAYLSYGLSWLATALVLYRQSRSGGPAQSHVVALLSWTALNTVLVCAYWSDPLRYAGSLFAALLVLGALGSQALARTALWQPRRQDLPALGAMLVLGSMLVTTLGTYYMGSRLTSVGSDAQGRLTHIDNSLSLMHGGGDALFGIGLGRFPERYMWAGNNPGVPGTLSLHGEGSGHFMRIARPPRTPAAEETIVLSQRVAAGVPGPFQFSLRARSEQDVSLQVSICRKNFLYNDGCAQQRVSLKGGAGWQTLAGRSTTAMPGPGGLWRPAVLSIHLLDQAHVDLDELNVVDAAWTPLVRNGDFEQGADFWFFSSDRDHLPWHAKNLLTHVYVEHGLLGLLPLLLGLTIAPLRLLRHPNRLQAHAPAILASLAGVATVGLVDSLLDIPRITVFVLLMLWLALTLRQPAGTR